MKIALNGATTMKADLSTDIRAASAAGFDLLEIWSAKLYRYLATQSVEDLKAEFEELGIKPYSINSIEHITFRSEAEYARIKEECTFLSDVAGQIGCPYIVVVPGKLPGSADRDAIIDESVRVLRELSEIAAERSVALAFEFLGQADCSVQTLDLASEVVSRLDCSNVGLVLDTFHFYAGNSTFEAIGSLDPEQIFIFHINDAEDLPREKLTDAKRLFPGLGILPLDEIATALRNIGYDRMASVEIFRPEYWDMDPFDVARRARETTAQTLSIGEYAASGTW